MASNFAGAVSSISRFNPDFCLTIFPGLSSVPFAVRVMFRMVSFSVAKSVYSFARS